MTKENQIKTTGFTTALPDRTVTFNSSANGRVVICDALTEAIIEDAQGFGFSSYQKAANYANSQGWHFTPNRPETPPLF